MSTQDPQSDALPPSASSELGFDPVGGLLAIMVPGLGHWMRQQRRRALYIASGVFGLFFTGLFIGGIDVIDSKGENRIWFVGQAFVGPIALGIDWAHQNRFKVYDPVTGELRSAYPDEIRSPGGAALPAQSGQRPPNIKGMAKVNELGTLFCTLAGMMNLIVIIDATFPKRRVRPATLAAPLPDPMAAPSPSLSPGPSPAPGPGPITEPKGEA